MKPRLFYIHQYFNTLEMPGGTRSYELATRFVREGYDVTMLTSDREKCIGFPRREVIDGINVIWVPCMYRNDFGVVLRCLSFAYFSFISCLYALFYKFDICFATSTPLSVGVPALLAKRIRRRPYVFEVRDLWPEMPIAIGAVRNRFAIWVLKRLESSIYRHASTIVALSPGMADGIQEVLSVIEVERKVVTAPNSCDFERMALSLDEETRQKTRLELNVTGDQKLFLYAGSIGKLNDLDFLLDVAIESLHNDRIQFVIIGGGIRGAKIQERIQSEALTNVTFMSRVPKLKMPGYFAACDAGLSLFIDIPEMQKNSANKFFDTLAVGKPAIINYGGWQADFLKATNTGRQISRDIHTAARELGEFCDNAHEYQAQEIIDAAQVFSRDAIFETVHRSVSELVVNR